MFHKNHTREISPLHKQNRNSGRWMLSRELEVWCLCVHERQRREKRFLYFEIMGISLATPCLLYPVGPDLLFSSVLQPFSVFVCVVLNLRHFHWHRLWPCWSKDSERLMFCFSYPEHLFFPSSFSASSIRLWFSPDLLSHTHPWLLPHLAHPSFEFLLILYLKNSFYSYFAYFSSLVIMMCYLFHYYNAIFPLSIWMTSFLNFNIISFSTTTPFCIIENSPWLKKK